MNTLLIIFGLIPGACVLILLIKWGIEAYLDECFYFVSYHWDSIKQSGHGSLEVPLHGHSLDSYDDIEEIKDYIEDLIKDEYGNSINVIILSFAKLPKASKNGKTQHIFFTDEGVKVNNLKKKK